MCPIRDWVRRAIHALPRGIRLRFSFPVRRGGCGFAAGNRPGLNYVYSTYDDRGPSLSPNPDKRSNNAVLGRAQFDF